MEPAPAAAERSSSLLRRSASVGSTGGARRAALGCAEARAAGTARLSPLGGMTQGVTMGEHPAFLWEVKRRGETNEIGEGVQESATIARERHRRGKRERKRADRVRLLSCTAAPWVQITYGTQRAKSRA